MVENKGCDMRWVSIIEKSILFGDDLNCFINVFKKLPDGQSYDPEEFDQKIYRLFLSSKDEPYSMIKKRLANLCLLQNSVQRQINEYKTSAIFYLWKKKRKKKECEEERKCVEDAETRRAQQDDFTTTLVMAMIIPIADSVAKTNPGISHAILDSLLSLLAVKSPWSMTGNDQQLDSLQDLLQSWLKRNSSDEQTMRKVLTTISCLICVRTSLPPIIRALRCMVEVLQNDVEIPKLKIIDEFCNSYVNHLAFPALLSNIKPREMFRFDDEPFFVRDYSDYATEKYSLTMIDDFVIATDERGQGLKKIAVKSLPGIHKVGDICNQRAFLPKGLIAYAQGILLHKPLDKVQGFTVIDPNTLEILAELPELKELEAPQSSKTLNFISDGFDFYLIRSFILKENDEESSWINVVFADTFKLESCLVKIAHHRRTVIYKDKKHSFSGVAFQKLMEDSEHLDVPKEDVPLTTLGMCLSLLKTLPMWAKDGFLTVLIPSSGKITDEIIGIAMHFDLSTGSLVQENSLKCSDGAVKRHWRVSGMGAVYSPRTNSVLCISNGTIYINENDGSPSIKEARKLLSLKQESFMSNKNFISSNLLMKYLISYAGISSYSARISEQLLDEASPSIIQDAIFLLDRFQRKDEPSMILCIIAFLDDITRRNRSDENSNDAIIRSLINFLSKSKLEPYTVKLPTRLLGYLASKGSNRYLKDIIILQDHDVDSFYATLEEFCSQQKRLLDLSEGLKNVENHIEQFAVLLHILKTHSISELSKENYSTSMRVLNGASSYLIKIVSELANLAISDDNWKNKFIFMVKQILHASNMVLRALSSRLKKKNEVSDAYIAKLMNHIVLNSPLDLLAISVTALCHKNFLNAEDSHEIVQETIETLVLCTKSRFLLKSQEGESADTSIESKSLLLSPSFTVETPHPVRDGYKLRETIYFPSAKFITLTFDSRCTTRDKLCILVKGTKVGEFQGAHGGDGNWPVEPLRINGDSVTFMYETRGTARDSSTAMSRERPVWGFSVKATRDSVPDEKRREDNFEKLHIILCHLVMKQLQSLFDGNERNSNEDQCLSLLKSQFLEKYAWPNEASEPTTHSRLSQETLQFLDDLAMKEGLIGPTIRKSIDEVIESKELKTAILEAVVSHLLSFSGSDTSVNESFLQSYSKILHFVIQKTHALLRRLQTCAQLEALWHDEIVILKAKNQPDSLEPFFKDYAYEESSIPELELLGFMMKLDVTNMTAHQLVKELKNTLLKESAQISEKERDIYQVTRKIVTGVKERILLLTKMTYRNDPHAKKLRQSRSLENTAPKRPKLTRRQSLQLIKNMDMTSLSIPSCQRENMRERKIMSKLIKNQGSDTHEDLITSHFEEAFNFIGYCPEQSTSIEVIVDAIKARKQRSRFRNQALGLMRGLLNMCSAYGNNAFINLETAKILSNGPKIEDLNGSGITSSIRANYMACLSDLVGQIFANPFQNRIAVCYLGMLPLEKEDEISLVKTRIIEYLGKLCNDCSQQWEETPNEAQSLDQTLGKVGWLVLKCFAQTCIDWGTTKVPGCQEMQKESLAREISKLVMLNLNIIERKPSINTATTLFEVLGLLKTLSSIEFGMDLLKQVDCLKWLLILMERENLSPRLLSLLFALLDKSLPYLNDEDIETFGNSIGSRTSIISLLLRKLSTLITEESEMAPDSTLNSEFKESLKEAPDQFPDDGVTRKQMALYLHKHSSQNAHDLLEELLENQRIVNSLFHGRSFHNVEKLMRLEKNLSKTGKGELMIGNNQKVLEMARILANAGFVLSIGESDISDADDFDSLSLAEKVCRKKNITLGISTQFKPFLSNQLANKFANECIQLIHRLIHENSRNGQAWRESFLAIAENSLMHLKRILTFDWNQFDNHQDAAMIQEFQKSKQISAVLAVLGGFYETFKPGTEVVVEPDESRAEIVSCDWQNNFSSLRTFTGNTVKVSTSRLKHVPEKDSILQKNSLLLWPLSCQIINIFHEVDKRKRQSALDYLENVYPVKGDMLSLQLARIQSHVKMQFFKVTFQLMKEHNLCEFFLRQSCKTVDLLKCIARECHPSDKTLPSEQLNFLLCSAYQEFKFCKQKSYPRSDQNQNVWNAQQNQPMISSAIFKDDLLGVEVIKPGSILFASRSIDNDQGYFESTIIQMKFSDGVESNPRLLRIGLATQEQSLADSIFYCNDGEMSKNEAGRKSQTAHDIPWHEGDIIGLEYLLSNQDITVTFSVNGRKSKTSLKSEDLAQVPLYPTLHFVGYGEVHTNFGQKPFACFNPLGITENQLGSLMSDDKEISAKPPMQLGGNRRTSSRRCRPALRVRETNSYVKSDKNRIRTFGNVAPFSAHSYRNSSANSCSFESDSDDEMNVDQADVSESSCQNLYKLLQKAWESHVFPLIRHRFRNEAERHEGLEQIRGALALGMTDIARQTVEFLFEDTGGLPRELHLPTLADIREDMSKFTIDKLRRGDHVIIYMCNTESEEESKILPFAIHPQLRTNGLVGQVIELDFQYDLVKVETYIEEDGVLVQFWYPISVLKRPEHTQYKKNTQSHSKFKKHLNNDIHNEILSSDLTLCKLFCRKIYNKLLLYVRANSNRLSIRHETDHVLQSNTMMLCDLDVENAQLINEECLEENLETKNVWDRVLGFSHPGQMWASVFGCVSKKFYKESKNIELELDRIIKNCLSLDEQPSISLDEVTLQLCQCLLNPESFFCYENIEVNEFTTMITSVVMKDASFILIEPKALLEPGFPTSLKISIYARTNHEISYSGQRKWQLVEQIPVHDVPNKLIPILMPEEEIRISSCGSGEAKVTIDLFSIPSALPLALLFMERLHIFSKTRPSFHIKKALNEALQTLIQFITKCQSPHTLKQLIFTHLANLMPEYQSKLKTDQRESELIASLYSELCDFYLTESVQGKFLMSEYIQVLFWMTTSMTDMGWESQNRVELPRKLEDAFRVSDLLRNIRQTNKLIMSTLLQKRFQTNQGQRFLILTDFPSDKTMDQIKNELVSILAPLGGLLNDEIEVFGKPNASPHKVWAAIQIRFLENKERVKTALQNRQFTLHEVDGNHFVANEEGFAIWKEYLRRKLKNPQTIQVVSEQIFSLSSRALGVEERLESFQTFHVIRRHPLNMIHKFLQCVTSKKSHMEKIDELFQDYGRSCRNQDQFDCSENQDEVKKDPNSLCLDLFGLQKFLEDVGEKDIIQLLKGLSLCGYEIGSEIIIPSTSDLDVYVWNQHEDENIIAEANHLSLDYGLKPTQLQPLEIFPAKSSLSPSMILARRERFALLKSLNSSLGDIIPLTNTSLSLEYPSSLAGILFREKDVIMTSVKNNILTDIVNQTSVKIRDHVVPEIILNPTDSLNSEQDLRKTFFYQAMKQMGEISNSDMLLPIPQGSDPIYPIRVAMSGEEVQGNSGSFRQLFANLVHEVQSGKCSLVVPYLGDGAFKGLHFLRPGNTTLELEDQLKFLGKVFGLSIRANVPLPIDMMPTFWKSLLCHTFNESDLLRYDPITYHHLEKVARSQTNEEFESIMEESYATTFQYPSIDGTIVELVKDGANCEIRFENRSEYAELVKKFRLSEYENKSRMNHIRLGMAAIVPLNVIMTLFSPGELENRICGSKTVTSAYLKARTKYLSGLTERDRHIGLFWSVLEDLSPRQLQIFVKFACNQERLPQTSEGDSDTVPPLPMKIAPPDRMVEDADKQLIRVETCMFLVKLPPYSSYEVMRAQILLASGSAYDPLSG